MRRRLLALVAAVALSGTLSAADERPPMVIRLNDVVHLKNGNHFEGRIISHRQEDGTLILKKIAGSGNNEIEITAGEIDHVVKRQTAAEVVERRGTMDIEMGDIVDLEKVLRWGMANGAKDVALEVARVAMARRASQDLAEKVGPMLIESGDLEGAVQFVRPLLDKNPQWGWGYETLAKLYLDLKREGELFRLVDRWLEIQPTAITPNRLRARASETSGDLRTAREAYRKGFDIHKDWESGIGYARCSLKLGQTAEALATAEALIQAGKSVAEARAIAGCALLAQGEAAKAEPLLTEAVAAAGVSPEIADAARYDLGLIAFRAGRLDQARERWTGLAVPHAELGLAMLDRKPYTRKDVPPEVAAIAAEYNACIDIEGKRFDQAAAAIDPKQGRRQAFLAQLAALKHPTEEAVKALAATTGAESSRWQAYGHIQGRRWALAEAALAQLPPDDGYAAVCRVYIAEARKDSAGARALYAKARDAVDAPAEYLEVLAREYESADDDLQVESFEGARTDLETRDWRFSQPGTGIDIRTDEGRLVLEGTQTDGEDPVTRSYRQVAAGAVRHAQATLELAGANGASCGIELLDLGRANGIAFGVTPDNKLGWRQRTQGAWGAWQTIDLEARNVQVLRLELDRGVVTAVCPDEPRMRKPLAQGMFKDQAELCVGVFGAASPGTAWSLGVAEFQLRTRPLPKSGR